MELVFASANKNKIKEINVLLPASIKLLSLSDIGCTADIPETADTIEGNAILKAEYVHLNFGRSCFADDSGLEVDALNGAPGVYSARYAGEPKNDLNNIQKLLRALEGQTNRRARFKTVIALVLNGTLHCFEGTVNGTIIHDLRGNNGFGYDPVFVPEGHERTFAEMELAEKNAMSHRARAVQKLVAFLSGLYE